MGRKARRGFRFSWDDAKARLVWKEHRLRLEELCAVFDSPYIEAYDDDHSDREERYRALGLLGETVVVVVYAFRDEGEIRLITAWKANSSEQERYYIETFGDER